MIHVVYILKIIKMRKIRTKTILDVIDTLEAIKKTNEKPASLHDVIIMLMKIDVKDETLAKLRYSSTHLVLCSTPNTPGLIALVTYNDTNSLTDSKSYVVDFYDIDRLFWNMAEEEEWFFWVTDEVIKEKSLLDETF